MLPKIARHWLHKKGVRRTKTFKNLHIDLEKKIFLLDGEPLRQTVGLYLDYEFGKWTLQLTQKIDYQLQCPNGINGKEGDEHGRLQEHSY